MRMVIENSFENFTFALLKPSDEKEKCHHFRDQRPGY